MREHHRGAPVAWYVPFAAVQLLIGLGLLAPRTVRIALAASLPWSLGVWFFGEGLSGLASGHASLLTGAPGAVLLYGVLALAAWPGSDPSLEAPSGWLPAAWAVLWAGGAIFQALPGLGSALGRRRDLPGAAGTEHRHGDRGCDQQPAPAAFPAGSADSTRRSPVGQRATERRSLQHWSSPRC